MIQTFAVIGGDARQRYLAGLLMSAGFCVSCYQVPALADTHASLHAAVQNAQAVVLPMPALHTPTQIRAASAVCRLLRFWNPFPPVHTFWAANSPQQRRFLRNTPYA